MKTLITKIMILGTFLSFFGCRDKSDPSAWSESKINEWFEKGEWINGWNIAPDNSINRKTMAVNYHKNKDRWDSAFAFLRSNDLGKLEVKRYDIDGDNLYVSVSEYNTKNEEDARYESHQKYIDIQYVASGKEYIGLAPVASKDSILQAYDATKDIEFMTVKNGENLIASPDRFFVFFPEDLHRPGIRIDSTAPVRKIVVKVRID